MKAKQVDPAGNIATDIPQRPIGISIISVLGLISGAIGVIIAAGLIVLALTSPPEGPRGAGGAFVAFTAGLVVLIISVPAIIVNIGLFQMKGWARVTSIVVSIITIVLALGAILLIIPTGPSFSPWNTLVEVVAVIIVVIHAIIIYYLSRVSVQQAFQRA